MNERLASLRSGPMFALLTAAEMGVAWCGVACFVRLRCYEMGWDGLRMAPTQREGRESE